jgi:ABC-2 type transport system ATP-binding protein
VLRHVGLAEERYRPMGGYSTGMKQRAKLAQALVHDPRLVLLDEPTNGLDPSSRDDMLALVRRIGTEFGIAVLVTSHLLGELERISDHVVVLDNGRLLRSSATTAFLHKTGSLLVEVQGPTDADRLLGQALVDAGLRVRPVDGRMLEVEVLDESTRDVVRDLTVDLGLGLVRMQERHHRIEDVFREGGAGSVQPV